MTVRTESIEHPHHPRIFITDTLNIASLYTLSHLTHSKENIYVYYESQEDPLNHAHSEEMVQRICPGAIRQSGQIEKISRGMERSVLYLHRALHDSEYLMAPLQGYNRFVLIISMLGAENPTKFPFAKKYADLEEKAKGMGYQSYCILRLPPLFQHLKRLDPTILEEFKSSGDGIIYGIDANDAGSLISHILLDPEVHKEEQYSIFCPSSISLSTLHSIQDNLPGVLGPPFQSSESVRESIQHDYWHLLENSSNDIVAITGGMDTITDFDGFLRNCRESLFHQRFLMK